MARLDRARVVVVMADSSKVPNSIIVEDGNVEFKVRTQFWKWVKDVENEEIITEIITDKEGTGILIGNMQRTTASGEFNANAGTEERSEGNEESKEGNPNDVHVNEFEMMRVSDDVSKMEFREDIVKEMEVGQKRQRSCKIKPTEGCPEVCEQRIVEWAPVLQSEAHNKIHKGEAQHKDGTPKPARKDLEDCEQRSIEWVPETQSEVHISQSNNAQKRAEERGESSGFQIDERDRERRMVVYCEDRVGSKEILSNGGNFQSEEISMEEMIRREIKMMINEGNDLGFRFRQQGESLETELQSVLARIDRRF